VGRDLNFRWPVLANISDLKRRGYMDQPYCCFPQQGFAVLPDVIDVRQCDTLATRLEEMEVAGAGCRALLAFPWCAELAHQLRRHAVLSALLPPVAVATQCTFFKKTPEKNWLVPLHQDRSILVRERVDSLECSGWSEKEGEIYVQPPTAVLADLVVVRVHVDACPAESGALRVVPGSHALGRLSKEQADSLRLGLGEQVVPVPRGGALVMRPLLLHASSKATNRSARRVLHFLFGPPGLPADLTWKYAV
jgi:hypothetical protein